MKYGEIDTAARDDPGIMTSVGGGGGAVAPQPEQKRLLVGGSSTRTFNFKPRQTQVVKFHSLPATSTGARGTGPTVRRPNGAGIKPPPESNRQANSFPPPFHNFHPPSGRHAFLIREEAADSAGCPAWYSWPAPFPRQPSFKLLTIINIVNNRVQVSLIAWKRLPRPRNERT